MQRKAIESLYIDTCDIIQLVSVKNPVNKRVEQAEQVVHSTVPCRLSMKTVPQASDSNTASTAMQITKIFLAPELEIPEGSKFRVTHYGREFKYESSGFPAIYSSHQEIVLERKDWA